MIAHENFPMFPLGRPCLPGGVLPLRIFESRYVQMLEEVLREESPEFGVVMIDRGSEVGGGDVRRSIGTRMSIASVEQISHGQFAVIAIALDRLRVTEWLPDDPYPKGRVEPFPPEGVGPLVAEDAFIEVTNNERLPRLNQALHSPELDLEILRAFDDSAKIFALASLLPIGSLDLQRLLETTNEQDLAVVMEGILEHLEDLSRFTEM